jgi:hypothetical protein
MQYWQKKYVDRRTFLFHRDPATVPQISKISIELAARPLLGPEYRGLHDFKVKNRQAHYILDVVIEPDPPLKDDPGYVLFTSGGHEGISL